ncbi:hypothetical protein NAL32_09500 [Chryseobacterium sp. Ch-15]|uniref:Uncharacterized protein n=1 Tax=Chryseobacterium muglaense TaxID=2893752 RepID=A0A9Q3UU09_9FLAO|nr:hypothetical protein [Chryseobacterium muglaense]MBD3905014.1 hypothetical protein [Chryseobacterium muglaense]MCC9035119.1 hypothetical protein [Chryseobacterium muglaense]MCM2554618.1 hypothetical protein [Chryseobacterium muglaense]
MRKIQIALLFFSLMNIAACNDSESKEDEVKDIDKRSAIETELSVQHIDTADVLITKHKIWKNNKLFKEIIKRDTIPSLGDTLQTVEDEAENERIAKVKKDYEFYITVQ